MALGIGGVLLGIGLLWGLAWLASSGEVEVQLGDDVFEAGRTDSLSDAIERDGPIPFADVAGGDRDIILQHVGSEESEGWLAFDARAPGASRKCSLEWDADAGEFVDPCSGERYPPDGEGLRQYPVTVEEGRLEVDLRGSIEEVE